MSYSAKPNFIIYDEWFDEDFKKSNIDDQNKKINNISNIHQFFYEFSKSKIGASENHFQLEIKENQKKLIYSNHPEKKSERLGLVSNKKFQNFKKITRSKPKFNIKKRLIYSLSIFCFILIFGLILFFIS